MSGNDVTTLRNEISDLKVGLAEVNSGLRVDIADVRREQSSAATVVNTLSNDMADIKRDLSKLVNGDEKTKSVFERLDRLEEGIASYQAVKGAVLTAIGKIIVAVIIAATIAFLGGGVLYLVGGP